MMLMPAPGPAAAHMDCHSVLCTWALPPSEDPTTPGRLRLDAVIWNSMRQQWDLKDWALDPLKNNFTRWAPITARSA